MPYWQLFYHIVWTTKDREPLLTPDVEPAIHEFLRAKAASLGGIVLALNGAADHVHMVAAIPPRMAVAQFINQIKSMAAAQFNRTEPPAPLFWQGEYGIFSCDRKRLPNYIAYVEQQKEHHEQGTAIPVLERTGEGPLQAAREPDIDTEQ